MRKLLFFLSALAVHANALDIDSVKICGDGAQWPPFHYLDKHGTAKGYDLDVLEYSLGTKGITFEFSMPPWRRCLYNVAAGEFHIAVSAAYSEQRNKNYLLTTDYYSVTPAVVAKRADVGDKQAYRLNELKELKLCGLKGYSYSFLKQIKNTIISVDDHYEGAFKALYSRRCEAIAVRKEILAGHKF